VSEELYVSMPTTRAQRALRCVVPLVVATAIGYAASALVRRQGDRLVEALAASVIVLAALCAMQQATHELWTRRRLDALSNQLVRLARARADTPPTMPGLRLSEAIAAEERDAAERGRS